MATFTININSEQIPNNILLNEEVCGSSSLSIPLGLSKTTGSGDTQYLYGTDSIRTGWTSMAITALEYSDSFSCYLEYNSVKINTGDIPTVINVTGVNVNDAIAGLLLKANLLEGGNASVSINYTVELSNGTDTLKKSGNIAIIINPCSQPDGPSISGTMGATPECGIYGEARKMTVNAESNTTIKLHVRTIDNGNHGAKITLTADGVDQGVNTTIANKLIYYDMGSKSNVDFILSVCARPTLNLSQTNEVSVILELYQSVDSTVVVGSMTVIDINDPNDPNNL